MVPSERLLADDLARMILGWRVHPDRYIQDNRSWIPAWRFQPTKNLTDGLMLLEKADVDFVIERRGRDRFAVSLNAGQRTSRTHGTSLPLAICRALEGLLATHPISEETPRHMEAD